MYVYMYVLFRHIKTFMSYHTKDKNVSYYRVSQKNCSTFDKILKK